MGSYVLIRNVFRWLALALLAYIGAAILAKPDVLSTIRGTFIPTIHFDKTFLSGGGHRYLAFGLPLHLAIKRTHDHKGL
jgi:hypothetical protein